MSLIEVNDLEDTGVISQDELIADGLTPYISGVTITSTTSSTKEVVVVGLDLFRDDEKLEAGDKVVITGTSGGLGDGTFTVNSILAIDTFDVVEVIGDSTGGSFNSFYKSGASSIGVDPTNLTFSTNTILQEVLEDIEPLPIVSSGGFFLISQNTGIFTPVHPVIGSAGMMYTGDGCMYIWE